jgi:hypothetical protein
MTVGSLVLVDGTSGAGKTTRAQQLAAGTGARVLHMDDLYAGWEGMAHATATLERILTERAAGRTPRWRRWDWQASTWGAEDRVAPRVPLVVEGCGSVTAVTAGLADRVLWLDAPEPGRRLLVGGLEAAGEGPPRRPRPAAVGDGLNRRTGGRRPVSGPTWIGAVRRVACGVRPRR